MTTKQKFWTTYFTIAFIYAVYTDIWGETHYKSFAYNLGRAFIWPAIMFPALGQIIGAIILVVVIIALLVMR